MRLDKYSGIDPYTYPNGVLKNKHYIQDEKLLEELERITVATRIVQLRENPIKGNFDLAHLRKIHRHLFQDIYDWAGKIRTVDISKGNSRFCSYHLIQSYSETIAKKFKQQQWQNIAPKQFSEQSAYFLGEYNAVHPFREGNGRVIREMIGQLAKQNGYIIHWENITQDEMIKASEISTTLGNNQLLEKLIAKNLQSNLPTIDEKLLKQLCQPDFALRKAALHDPEISQALLERTAIHHKCPQTRKAAAAVLQQRCIEIPANNKPNTAPSKTVNKDKGIEI